MACHNGVRVVPPACGRARGGGARVWCGRMWWAGVWWRMWWRAPARGGGRVAGARVWRSIRHHIIAPRGRACAGFPRILFSRPHVVADSRARNRRKSSARKRLGRFHHHEPPACAGAAPAPARMCGRSKSARTIAGERFRRVWWCPARIARIPTSYIRGSCVWCPAHHTHHAHHAHTHAHIIGCENAGVRAARANRPEIGPHDSGRAVSRAGATLLGVRAIRARRAEIGFPA